MNKPLSASHHQLHKELVALRHCLKIAQEHGTTGLYESNRTEALKHFAHCAQEFLVFLSKYLKQIKFVETEAMSEREIIRHAYAQSILNQEEQRLLGTMLDDAHKAAQSHMNKKESAQKELMNRVSQYFAIMAPVTEKLAAELGIPDAHIAHAEVL